MSVNKVILVGRLGQDPELKDTQGGKKLCTFSLATSESWRDTDGNKKDKTTWHNVVAWGKTGEILAQYLGKGQQVYLEGRIDNQVYEKDGQKQYSSKVVVDGFRFIGNKPTQQTAPSENGNGEDDDLPF